jgi:phosphoserine phosphatase
MIVFDFDKTLTYEDTTLSFFCHGLNTIPRVFISSQYYVLAFLVKMHFIEVLTLKSILLKWRFKNIEKNQWEKHCKDFAATIKTNLLYAQTDWTAIKLLIISAGFKDVLQHLFPHSVDVFASTVKCENGKWLIEDHLYRSRKREVLIENGIQEIDEFYTDSWHDRSVMEMAKKIYWVKGDQVTELKANR